MNATLHVDLTTPRKLAPELQAKYERLQAILREIGDAAVAYSGGVDSTLVAQVACDTLAGRVLAITALSESFPKSEQRRALALLDELGIPHVTVETTEVHDPQYASNPANRCYFCKLHVNGAILEAAEDRGFSTLLDGFNADDVGDYRPGRKAGRELGVRSPLHEAGLTKSDVRALARYLGLPNWAKPSMACLSSRVPYGSVITPEILEQIDQAEDVLHELGFEQVRVRHHDSTARLEVPVEQIPAVLEHREQIIAGVKAAGYVYVALDLQGFRSGSSNEELLRRD